MNRSFLITIYATIQQTASTFDMGKISYPNIFDRTGIDNPYVTADSTYIRSMLIRIKVRNLL